MGKLIVITGPDGSGKKMQAELLVKRLKEGNYGAETIDFPQYKKNLFGKMVGRYLAGEFGDPIKLNPYISSILYAGDRLESMGQIRQWLDDEKIVVCDRYTGDNFLHQGSKIVNLLDRGKFFDWLEELEFGVFGARRADIVFYLDVSLDVSLRLLKNKDAQDKKSYTSGKKDGHENEEHLMAVRKINEELIQRHEWVKINCMKDGEIIPPEEIHKIIWENLNSKVILF